MKREGQLWIKIFPDKPITKKPEVRMAKVKVQLSITVVETQQLNQRCCSRDSRSINYIIYETIRNKISSAAELQEKLSQTKKTYADLWLAHAISN
jgi:hypothetical protein